MPSSMDLTGGEDCTTSQLHPPSSRILEESEPEPLRCMYGTFLLMPHAQNSNAALGFLPHTQRAIIIATAIYRENKLPQKLPIAADSSTRAMGMEFSLPRVGSSESVGGVRPVAPYRAYARAAPVGFRYIRKRNERS